MTVDAQASCTILSAERGDAHDTQYRRQCPSCRSQKREARSEVPRRRGFGPAAPGACRRRAARSSGRGTAGRGGRVRLPPVPAARRHRHQRADRPAAGRKRRLTPAPRECAARRRAPVRVTAPSARPGTLKPMPREIVCPDPRRGERHPRSRSPAPAADGFQPAGSSHGDRGLPLRRQGTPAAAGRPFPPRGPAGTHRGARVSRRPRR